MVAEALQKIFFHAWSTPETTFCLVNFQKDMSEQVNLSLQWIVWSVNIFSNYRYCPRFKRKYLSKWKETKDILKFRPYFENDELRSMAV